MFKKFVYYFINIASYCVTDFKFLLLCNQFIVSFPIGKIQISNSSRMFGFSKLLLCCCTYHIKFFRINNI